MPNHTLVGRLTEASLAPAATLAEWCERICAAVEPIFERGGGVGAGLMLHPASRQQAPNGAGTILVAQEGVFDVLLDAGKRSQILRSTQKHFLPAFRPFQIAHLSSLLGRDRMRGFAPWDRVVTPAAYVDQLGLDFTSDGFSCLTCVLTDDGWAQRRVRDLHAIRRVLRRTVDARRRTLQPANADAVIAPDGRILDAPAGLGKDTRAMLSHAVRMLERARIDDRASEEGERLWDELLAGHWSVVEHLDCDGKRLLLLSRAEKSQLAGADADLLRRIESGSSIKRIAIDLELSFAAASERISAAIGKLGFGSRAQYLRYVDSGRAKRSSDNPYSACEGSAHRPKQ